MGVWIGALLSYATVVAPRASRVFILGQAAAGLEQLADELFGVLYRARSAGISVPSALESPPSQEVGSLASGEEQRPSTPARAA